MSDALPGRLLRDDPEFPALYRDWLAAGPDEAGAASDRRRFLTGDAVREPAPAWRDDAWRDRWLAELLEDLPHADARARARDAVAALAAGQAEVVVTGQQPGFLGGPLYTLWKAAAAVAAARTRTERGRPTVALFWSGDDDDDRLEAFAPWLWDPRRAAYLKAIAPEGPSDRMVGAAAAGDWGRGERAWLAERAAAGGFAADLATIWDTGAAAGLGWGRLHRRALLAAFGDVTLLAVSGRDPGLHALAAPLYARFWARRAQVAATVRDQGRRFEARGGHAQIGLASLERPLHLEEAGRRLTLPPDLYAAPAPPPAAALRPGVMLRAAVQDWLFGPAGVIVGPAETAYLLQLTGAYAALDLPRCPLLPRLFAVLAPAEEAAAAAAGDGGEASPGRDWEALARPVADAAAGALAPLLARELGLSPDEARRRAQREAGRWGQAAARRLASAAARRGAAGGAVATSWVRPLGRPQERTLAAHWATALWGREPVRLALAAAAWRDGGEAQPRWQVLPVPAPPG